jgi:hypothetical protein
MNKNILTIIRKIRKLEQERRRVLKGLLVPNPLLIGSLSRVKRTCGKPNCRCAEQPSHEVWTLATNSEAHRRCQVVRQADVKPVQKRLAVYKDFRAALRRLEAIRNEEKSLLRGLMEKRDVPYE